MDTPYELLRNDNQAYRKVHYTISDLAYEGLTTLLISKPKPPTLRPVLSAWRLDYVDDRREPKAEGLSWGLFLLTRFPLSGWQDTRPSHIIQQHTIQENGLAPYVEPTLSRRASWYYSVPPSEEPADEKDIETKGTLRHKRCLVMDGATRRYYADLTIKFHLEPRSTHHNIGSLIATALEAIGLRWLSPPDGYSTLLDTPNPNKSRPRAKDRVIHKRWDPSILMPVRHTPVPTTFTQADLDFYIIADLPELAQKAREYLDAQDISDGDSEDPSTT